MALVTKLTCIVLEDQVEVEKRFVLSVKGDEKGAEKFSYVVSHKTRLRDLMLNYTKRIGVTFNSVRFLYNGFPITPAFTTDVLQMKSGDVIDVIPWNEFRDTGAAQSTLITLPLVNGDKPIFLRLKDMRDDSILFYLIGRKTPLESLLLDYADRICELYEHIRLFYKGYHIDPKKTADVFEMEDGDIIYANHISVK